MLIAHERVADNVYYFQSQQYARVTAGVIAGPDMAVVIDTLAYPEETLEMRSFIEQQLQVPVRYVINTHYHGDHTQGTYLFPGAKVISHSLCYEYLETRAIPALEKQQKTDPSLRNAKVILPHVTFDDGEIGLQVGKKVIKIFPFPGHSFDSVAVLVEEDRVLFSGDTLMTVPFIADGDLEDSINSLKSLPKMGLENIVRGHGDIVLRGEVDEVVEDDINYLNELRKVVKKAQRRKFPLDMLEEIHIEECGKSRILLGGIAEQLHQQNMKALYKQMYGEPAVGSEVYYDE
jgi:glyoxylase-like metal-dependent hydrolase (beta-lactamase superfamily II)